MAEEQSNGYVRWRDLTEVERRVRADRRSELSELGASLSARLDVNIANVDNLDGRLDRVESTLDQQAGAWTLTKFLIGTNLALTVVGALTLVALFR